MTVTFSKKLDNMHVELIKQLYDELREDFYGFAIRTEEYIRWLCDKNPSFAGIFVVWFGRAPVGFAIISQERTHEGFRVLYVGDMYISRKRSSSELFSHLIKHITEYARQMALDEIMLWTYGSKTSLYHACAEQGFLPTPSPVLNIDIADRAFFNFLARVRTKKFQEDKFFSKANEIIKFILYSNGEISHISEIIFLKIAEGKIEAIKKYSPQPTIVIEAKKNNLSNIIFGNASPFIEMILGHIRVRPFWKILFVIKTIRHLSMNNSWYIPLCDSV